jgi:uncharacterized membrane protein
VRNSNHVHAEEHANSGINQRIAVAVTRSLSTMMAVWVIVAFMTIWIVGNVTFWHFDPAPFALLLIIINLPQIASTPLIMVGQSVLNRKSEIQEDENCERTLKIFRDVESVMLQNAEQLEILEEQNKLLTTQYLELTKQTEMLTALLTPPSTTVRRRVRKQEVIE